MNPIVLFSANYHTLWVSVSHTAGNPLETSQPQIRRRIFGRPTIRWKIPLAVRMAVKNLAGGLVCSWSKFANLFEGSEIDTDDDDATGCGVCCCIRKNSRGRRTSRTTGWNCGVLYTSATTADKADLSDMPRAAVAGNSESGVSDVIIRIGMEWLSGRRHSSCKCKLKHDNQHRAAYQNLSKWLPSSSTSSSLSQTTDASSQKLW